MQKRLLLAGSNSVSKVSFANQATGGVFGTNSIGTQATLGVTWGNNFWWISLDANRALGANYYDGTTQTGGTIIDRTGLMYRGAWTNFNTAVNAGYYQITSTASNFPSGAYKYGNLIVFDCGAFLQQVYITDGLDGNSERGVYMRSMYHEGAVSSITTGWIKLNKTIL